MNIKLHFAGKTVVILIFSLSTFLGLWPNTLVVTNSFKIMAQTPKKARTINKKSEKPFHHYQNKEYGFTIDIPSNLKLELNTETSDDGPLIRLTQDSYIDIMASYNATEWKDLADGVKFTLDNLQQDDKATNIQVLRQEKCLLGKIPAIHLVIEYISDQRSEPIIKDKFIAMRKSKNRNVDEEGINYSDINYELCLSTKKPNYAKDAKKFEQILKSWRATPVQEH